MGERKEQDEGKKPKAGAPVGQIEVCINSFGEIQTNIDIDRINAFLNENLEDKKLKKSQNPSGKTKK
jgi:hypothetical protein